MNDDLYDTGLNIRKAVAGETYVQAALDGADEFDRDFQRFVTEYCWGAVWGRPGLDRRTRSMLNIAMLAGTGKSHELKLHVQGAIRNGVSKDEISEILTQVAVYCGVPSGVEGFRVARAAFQELDAAEGHSYGQQREA